MSGMAWSHHLPGGVSRTRWLVALVGFLVLSGPGCTGWKTQDLPPRDLIAAKSPAMLRVTVLRPGLDQDTLEINAPRIEGDSLVGLVVPDAPFDRHGRADGRRIAIPLSEVGRIEVRGIDGPRTAAVVAVGIGVTALLVAATPSDDDGPPAATTMRISCPVVESWDGREWQIDSGTFGGAIAPALSRTDVDNLDHATVAGGMIRLRISDIADETEHVNEVRLVKARSEPGFTVSPDSDGRLFSIGPLIPPVAARGFGGKDVREILRTLDGRAWESNPAAWDTTASGSLRDGVEITFLRPAGARRAKLVVDGSNTPWSAALVFDLVAAHGRATSEWYRSLGGAVARGDAERLLGEGFLKVMVSTPQGWQGQGAFREAGPEVCKRQVHLLDLSNVEGDTLRIRLESIPSFWRVDRVGIDYTEEAGIEVVNLPLVRVSDKHGRDVRPLVLANDDSAYVMETGDAAELEFADDPRMPEPCSYLLFTTGWYQIHVPESGEPQVATLRRLGRDPGAVSRMAVARLHDAVDRLEARSR
jgi:hypothetical protein